MKYARFPSIKIIFIVSWCFLFSSLLRAESEKKKIEGPPTNSAGNKPGKKTSNSDSREGANSLNDALKEKKVNTKKGPTRVEIEEEEEEEKDPDSIQTKLKINIPTKHKFRPKRKTWIPIECKSEWRVVREDCNDPKKKSKFTLSYEPIDQDATYKVIRDRFSKGGKDPLQACTDHIINTASGNFIMLEEFTEFVKQLCISSGAATKDFEVEKW